MSIKIPVGLQLYSVRQDCAKDLPHVLREVARMGYQGVEFAGYHGYGPEQIRSMLDDLGLSCCGTHTHLPHLIGDAFEKTVEFCRVIGCRNLIVASLEKQYTDSPNAWRSTAELFNQIAERLKPYLMQTGYHNHHTEFAPLPDGSVPWDLFFANTRPDVIMQLDTGNALHAGVDVTPFLSRYPRRATTVHLKIGSTPLPIGEPDLNWPEFFNLCESVGGTKWYIIEQDKHEMPPLEGVELCLQRLRAMGK